MAAALTAKGIEATAVDAFAAGMVTDSSFGRARPVPDDGRMLRYLDEVTGVPVVTGFLGADQDGNITTLGRNGSDYSAALIGVAIAATEIQIWKDVDGVHTADPRLVPDARPIPTMGFEDIAHLASFGSKVLHPAAMGPAMQHGIRIRVRNTLSPEAPGTTIEATVDDALPAVRAIAHRTSVALVSVLVRQQHVRFLSRRQRHELVQPAREENVRFESPEVTEARVVALKFAKPQRQRRVEIVVQFQIGFLLS